MKLVFGVAFWMMASVVNATPVIRDLGFVVPKDVSLIPVRVCPPGSDRPAIYPGEKPRCEGAEKKKLDPITPEQFLQEFCPGAVMTSLNLNSAMASQCVVVGFDLPKSGCPALKSES